MELLKYNVFVLRLTGLWPDEPGSILRYFRRDLFIMFVVYPIFYFGSVGQFIHQLQELNGISFKALFSSIMSVIMGIDMFFTLMVFYIKRAKIIDLRQQLINLENFFVCPNVLKTEKKVRKYTILIMSYATLFGTPLVVLPMFQISTCKKHRPEILQNTTWPCGFYTPLWYPFTVHENPYYSIILIVILIHVFSFIFFGFGIRTYMFALIEHTIRHLKNLKRNLKIAIESNGKDAELGKCVEYHVAIIRFYQNVDDCYSYITLAIMTTMSTIMAMIEYHLVTEITFIGVIMFSTEMFGWTFMLFLLSYIPQKLWNESVKLSEHFYDYDWETCSISMQKDIRFMLQNMQTPLTLSYGPLGKLGLENFFHILYSAYSFFAILISMKQN